MVNSVGRGDLPQSNQLNQLGKNLEAKKLKGRQIGTFPKRTFAIAGMTMTAIAATVATGGLVAVGLGCMAVAAVSFKAAMNIHKETTLTSKEKQTLRLCRSLNKKVEKFQKAKQKLLNAKKISPKLEKRARRAYGSMVYTHNQAVKSANRLDSRFQFKQIKGASKNPPKTIRKTSKAQRQVQARTRADHVVESASLGAGIAALFF